VLIAPGCTTVDHREKRFCALLALVRCPYHDDIVDGYQERTDATGLRTSNRKHQLFAMLAQCVDSAAGTRSAGCLRAAPHWEY